MNNPELLVSVFALIISFISIVVSCKQHRDNKKFQQKLNDKNLEFQEKMTRESTQREVISKQPQITILPQARICDDGRYIISFVNEGTSEARNFRIDTYECQSKTNNTLILAEECGIHTISGGGIIDSIWKGVYNELGPVNSKIQITFEDVYSTKYSKEIHFHLYQNGEFKIIKGVCVQVD